MPGLVLKNVSKTYQNGRKVIQDFQLEVEKGEFVILAGPEGCGKTTLLRMIAGLEDITSGTLLIDDQDMTDADPKERNLAMLFQNSILYPGMNVRDNLLFALQMQRLPQNEMEARLKKTAELLALAPILSSMPDSLSPAETYRALLGRALMRWPEILLLDRTTAGMGQELVGDILKGLRKIHEKTGITVIYATDREEAVRMPGTRLVVMNEGTICQDGESQEVYENPCCRFVARFVGSRCGGGRRCGKTDVSGRFPEGPGKDRKGSLRMRISGKRSDSWNPSGLDEARFRRGTSGRFL